MSKFKTGDKVRIKLKEFTKTWNGQEGEITDIIKESRYPYIVKLFRNGGIICFDESELEPLREGKIFIFRK